MKLKFEDVKEDKHKHMFVFFNSCRQNDKLEQKVKHRAVKDQILGLILGSNKQKVYFPPLIVSDVQIKHSIHLNY